MVWNATTAQLDFSVIDDTVARAIGQTMPSDAPPTTETAIDDVHPLSSESGAEDSPGTSGGTEGRLPTGENTAADGSRNEKAQKTIEGSKTMQHELYDLEHIVMPGISVVLVDKEGAFRFASPSV